MRCALHNESLDPPFKLTGGVEKSGSNSGKDKNSVFLRDLSSSKIQHVIQESHVNV